MATTHVCERFLCAVISVLIIQGKHDAQLLSAPEEVKVYRDADLNELGVWQMNIEWTEGFANRITPDKVTYDIKIFYTEQKKLVHNETIELKANPAGYYKWSWTSPLPLQCTSHSVQLRSRSRHYTSPWTPLKTLPGKDLSDKKDIWIYPQNYVGRVGESINFCCILNSGYDENSISPGHFSIQISNRTFITGPIQERNPPAGEFDITCKTKGTTYYIGYAPEVYNMTCETRDLSSVECRWITLHQESILSFVSPTDYSVNERNCSHNICVLEMNPGVMNWTLNATNSLGTKIIFDTADPKHRVYLKSPVIFPIVLFTARNATLDWEWQNLPKYSSFPMICQVEVNDHIMNETFKGTGLSSVVLTNLEPSSLYKARVRCGSQEHFYKWGDWSNSITFNTKEDIPEAVDIWMHVFAEHTYVVWKSLSAAQSHGIITGYDLVMGNHTGRRKEHQLNVNKTPEALCYDLQTGNLTTDQVVSISARNSAGVSRPSSITIPISSPGYGVNNSIIKGNDSTFHVVWEPSPRFTCGYVLDWYPTYKLQPCVIKWKKVPPGVSSATISSDFKAGVKYTVSVYGCTSGGPFLLQRREGYMTELPPLGAVQNLSTKHKDLNVHLSWENVPEQEQRGFIKGFKVSYSHAGKDEENVIVDSSIHEYNFKNLKPGKTYAFTVKAFTSEGEGPGSEKILQVDLQGDMVIIDVVASVAVMSFILFIIAVFSNRNWRWVKTTIWPEVPKPKLSEELLKKNIYDWQVMDQLLCKESQVLKAKSPEFCPVQTVLELQYEYQETQALNNPYSKDSSWYQTPNNISEAVSVISIDFSYSELPCPGIDNRTYNMSDVHAADNASLSSYKPQTQNGSM